MATTFNAWPVIVMPATPAPKDIQISVQNVAGESANPFSGQQQTYDWNANWLEQTVSLPPMEETDAIAWVNFFVACKGIVSVFQISNATWAGLIPAAANTNGYWRMKTNTQKWSVSDGVLFGFSFDIREAI